MNHPRHLTDQSNTQALFMYNQHVYSYVQSGIDKIGVLNYSTNVVASSNCVPIG